MPRPILLALLCSVFALPAFADPVEYDDTPTFEPDITPRPPAGADPDALFADAGRKALDGRHGEAAALLRGFLSDFPEHARVPEVLYALGHSLEALGRHDQAIDAWRTLRHAWPQWTALSDLLARVGRSFDARAARQVEANELRRKQIDEAIRAELLRTPLPKDKDGRTRVEKEVADRWNALGEAGATLERDFRRQALDTWRELLALFPRAPQAREAAGALADRENRHLTLHFARPFRTDEEVVLQLRHQGMGDCALRVRRLDSEAVEARALAVGHADLRDFFDRESAANQGTIAVERTLRLWNAAEPEEIEVPLGRLPAGVYGVEIAESYFRGWIPLLVSDLAVVQASAGTDAAALLVDSASGAPGAGTIHAFPRPEAGEKPEDPAKFAAAADGIARFTLPHRGFGLFARRGEHFATTEGAWRSARTHVAAGPEECNLVYTDRPIYLPGHTVHWRAILRTLADAGFELPAGDPVTVRVHDPRGNVVSSRRKTPDAFGCVSGEFAIAADGAAGTFTIRPSTGGSATFKVEAYRLPAFHLDVVAPTGTVLGGDTAEVGVAASYFFARPVDGAAVTADLGSGGCIEPHPLLRTPRALPRVHSRGLSWSQGRVETETGADGKAVLRFPARRRGTDEQYHFRVTVTDRSRRTSHDWVQFPVYAGSIVLVVEADRGPRPGERFPFDVRAIHLDGRPAAGLPISVRMSRLAPTEADRDHWEPGEKFDGTTGADGIVTFSADAGVQGMLRLEAGAQDPEGRAISYAGELCVGGWRRPENARALVLSFDQEGYAPGGAATLRIESTLDAGPAFLVVATGGLRMVSPVAIENGVTLVPIALDPRWFPGAAVQVAAVRRGALHVETAWLKVSPEERRLTLAISTDQEAYAPRERVRCRIAVTDAAGRPAPSAQVSLAAVDEAIYTLAQDHTPDLPGHFHGIPWSAPVWIHSFQFDARLHIDFCIEDARGLMSAFGGRFGGRSHLVARGGGGMAGERDLRRDFPDTVYWNPAILTGPDGTAEVEFPAADAITTYRLSARAVTVDTFTGAGRGSLRVDRAFFVQIFAPRHFTAGDRSAVAVVVHDGRAQRAPVTLEIEVRGATVDGATSRTLTAEQAAQGRAEWLLDVSEGRDVVIACRAASGDERDGVELTVPVRRLGASRALALAGEVRGRASEKVMLGSRGGARDLRVTLGAGKAGPMRESLEYLAGYPYGCVEQTLSRFGPSVACRRVLQASGRMPAGDLRELPRMVEVGLQRLYAMQHRDGGWGWWSKDESDVLLTAHILRGLEQARAADAGVDEGVIARARAWLLGAAEKEEDAVKLAAIACAAAGSDVASQKALDRAWERRDALTDHGRALLVTALARGGRREQAIDEAELLRGRAVGSGRGVFWRSQAARTSWMDGDVEATGDAVRALVLLDPADALAARGVDWILAARRGGRWGSTRATAAAVFACADWLAANPETEATVRCKVTWNGATIHDGAVGGEGALPFVRIAVPDAGLHDGSNDLEIACEGRAVVHYDVAWTEDEAGAVAEPRSSAGVDVTRSWHRVRRAADGGWEMDPRPLAPGDVVAAGEEIEVRVAIESVRDYEYVLLEDPKPAGFEWTSWTVGGANMQEARDDRMVFAFTRLSEGTTELGYRLRAETPGRFGTGPATVTHMYSERLFALSAGGVLEVK